jgi:predicted enzyme related to lactoylglutathione lyase
MAHVTGIGGVFFKARDPQALKRWYIEHLGFPVEDDGTVMFHWGSEQGLTVWETFDLGTDYFQPSTAPLMINYRVDDLDGLLAQLRAAGVTVDDRIDEEPYGRFGWAMDPEGNRLELWQPSA